MTSPPQTSVSIESNSRARDEAVEARGDIDGGTGAPLRVYVYPEADHAFLNDDRADVCRVADAADARARIESFLRDRLARDLQPAPEGVT